MKKLLIITNYLNIFPQRINYTESINLQIIESYLKVKNIKTCIINFDELNKNIRIADKYDYIFYCSSQNQLYKSFIADHILKFYLDGKCIIPRIEHLFAHENKAFQTIFLSNKKINYPKSRIISNYDEGIEFLKTSSFPIVLKTSEGWGSKGVHLIKDFEDGDDLLKLHILSEDYPSKKCGKIIFQQFISNLDGDWKILIFGNKIACLYRGVNQGDFRASGSGKFEFKQAPKKVLDFAFDVKNKLQCNWIYLDVMVSRKKIFLGEYQVTHFGLLTALNCPKHYEKISNGYKEYDGPINVDLEIAKELANIIDEN